MSDITDFFGINEVEADLSENGYFWLNLDIDDRIIETSIRFDDPKRQKVLKISHDDTAFLKEHWNIESDNDIERALDIIVIEALHTMVSEVGKDDLLSMIGKLMNSSNDDANLRWNNIYTFIYLHLDKAHAEYNKLFKEYTENKKSCVAENEDRKMFITEL